MSELDVNGEGFNIHVVGEATGKTWVGAFRAKKRLSVRDQLLLDQLRRDYLGTNSAEASIPAINFATIMSELKVRLTDKPEWWISLSDGASLEDYNVLLEVYEKTMKVEKDAIDTRKKTAEAMVDVLKTETKKE